MTKLTPPENRSQPRLSQRIVNTVQERFRLWNKYCQLLTTIYSVEKDKTDTVNERERERENEQQVSLLRLLQDACRFVHSEKRTQRGRDGFFFFFSFPFYLFKYFFFHSMVLVGRGGIMQRHIWDGQDVSGQGGRRKLEGGRTGSQDEDWSLWSREVLE